MNSLPKTVTQQRRDCDLNPDPTAPESSTLPLSYIFLILVLCLLRIVSLTVKKMRYVVHDAVHCSILCQKRRSVT